VYSVGKVNVMGILSLFPFAVEDVCPHCGKHVTFAEGQMSLHIEEWGMEFDEYTRLVECLHCHMLVRMKL